MTMQICTGRKRFAVYVGELVYGDDGLPFGTFPLADPYPALVRAGETIEDAIGLGADQQILWVLELTSGQFRDLCLWLQAKQAIRDVFRELDEDIEF